ncbi:hypothetical protein [Nostoc sp.]
MALVQRAISFEVENQLLLVPSHFRETFGAIAYKNQTMHFLKQAIAS